METRKLIEVYEGRVVDLLEEKNQIYEVQEHIMKLMTERTLKGQCSNYLRKCLGALNRQSLGVNAEILSTRDHIRHLENLEKQEKSQGVTEELSFLIECCS